MLVRFTSKKVASVSMFEKDARQMLKLMGRTDTIPSAIRGSDVAGVLEYFKQELERVSQPEPPEEDPDIHDDDDDEEEQKKSEKVPLQRRAYPLKQLLEKAAQTEQNVMWDFERSFF